MKKTHFPPTHYDVILRNQPFILPFIERELVNISSRELEGPFGSTDEFSDIYGEYLDNYNKKFREHCIANYPSISCKEDFDEMFQSFPEYPTMMYSAEVDYVNSVNFNLYGKKVFNLTENLIDRLSVTELNAPAEFLRLPFKSCMFVLTGKTAIDALMAISGTEETSYSDAITVFIHERPFKEYTKLLITTSQVGYSRNRCLVKREILIHPDWSIDNAMRTDWNSLYEEHPDWLDKSAESLGSFLEVDDEDETLFYHEGRAFYRIILNAILYLSSNTPDIVESLSPCKEYKAGISKIKSRSKVEKRKRSIDKISELDGSIVGGSIPAIRVVKGHGELGFSTDSVHQELLRFMVRGHWRNQPYGENNLLRKLIFIEPYFKGPDAGDVINKPYIV
ncbi:MAG: hypothetical protein HRU20_24725 [Pseudomonadales bacterium]|nr:hypothetical protein [Pseudomonadales bacterium]